jgi:hypothetical protein
MIRHVADILQTYNATKVCRKCRQERSMRDYQLPRHKVCMHCKLKVCKMALAFQLDNLPPRSTAPALTSTREGYNKYQRERYREHYMKNKEPPIKPPRVKVCMRCGRKKLPSEFENYHVRICLQCDKPPPPVFT